jgi:hypothetical protein
MKTTATDKTLAKSLSDPSQPGLKFLSALTLQDVCDASLIPSYFFAHTCRKSFGSHSARSTAGSFKPSMTEPQRAAKKLLRLPEDAANQPL